MGLCCKGGNYLDEPNSAREIDIPGISNPVLLVEWLEALPYKERLALCDENRVQTQLLYGEPVLVEEIVGEWAKVIAIWQPSKKDSPWLSRLDPAFANTTYKANGMPRVPPEFLLQKYSSGIYNIIHYSF